MTTTTFMPNGKNWYIEFAKFRKIKLKVMAFFHVLFYVYFILVWFYFWRFCHFWLECMRHTHTFSLAHSFVRLFADSVISFFHLHFLFVVDNVVCVLAIFSSTLTDTHTQSPSNCAMSNWRKKDERKNEMNWIGVTICSPVLISPYKRFSFTRRIHRTRFISTVSHADRTRWVM